MSEQNSTKTKFFFSTRDLLNMAVLAALGGVASTYINALSDAVHAVLGFPGGTQWAAGLHVIWIVLAIAITGKPSTGIITGILKGTVELMSGNSHGVIILLVDLVAGLLVDFGFLLLRDKRSLLPYLIAGGLATGSNVLVFQIFAAVPMNILAASAILILFFVALVSGLIFAGFVPFLLLNTLTKAGVVKVPEQSTRSRKIGWYILIGVFLLATLLAVFLHANHKGPQNIEITGDVENTTTFPSQEFNPEMVTRQMEYKGVMTEYSGYPLLEIIEHTAPSTDADTLLIEASDGYAFLVSFEELESNPNILLVQNGQGQNTSFDVVGPESSKAWIRNVTNLTIIASEGLTIVDPDGNTHEFVPDDWVSEMDSTQIALPEGSQKLQGVPVWKVIEATLSEGTPIEVGFSNSAENLSFAWSEIEGNDKLRLFTVIEDTGISFALAEMSGKVHLFPVTQIKIR